MCLCAFSLAPLCLSFFAGIFLALCLFLCLWLALRPSSLSLSLDVSASFSLQQIVKQMVEKWKKGRRGGGKLEWSFFSQVSGSQVAPTLTGSESGQVQLLSRCCAMRGTCPEPRPGSGSRTGPGVGDPLRPETSFELRVPETDPSRPMGPGLGR